MSNSYLDLVKQTFNFPQEGIDVKEGYLHFNGLDLKSLIANHGTPLKLTYLPKIGMQIKKAKQMFANAFKRNKYEGKYFYCYCTKSSHFSFVVEEALKHDINLEIIGEPGRRDPAQIAGAAVGEIGNVAIRRRQADETTQPGRTRAGHLTDAAWPTGLVAEVAEIDPQGWLRFIERPQPGARAQHVEQPERITGHQGIAPKPQDLTAMHGCLHTVAAKDAG